VCINVFLIDWEDCNILVTLIHHRNNYILFLLKSPKIAQEREKGILYILSTNHWWFAIKHP